MLHKWLWEKDTRGDWFTISCCGFRYSRYASGRTIFEVAEWFKIAVILALIGAGGCVLALAAEYSQRTACQEHGLIVAKEVKYSARVGCYVLVGQEYRRVHFD